MMNPVNDQVIGIVGGMGPEAGVTLCNYILANTKAAADQEHLSLMLMSFPGHIPDRTAFLEGSPVNNPAYKIAEIIGRLENAGAGVVAIACNTCHVPEIFDVIQSELYKARSSVKLLSMPQETLAYLKTHHRPVKRLGLMTTNGTYHSGLYENLLRENGYEVILPGPALQRSCIHRMIYDPVFGIKANPGHLTPEVIALTGTAMDFFNEHGAQAILLGCTELSQLIHLKKVTGLLMIDTLRVLSLAVIREVKNSTLASLPFIDPNT